MEIIKYTSKRSVKTLLLDQALDMVELPCSVETKFVEDVGERFLIGKGIYSIPALYIKGCDKKKILSGNVTPKMIQDAIEAVK